MARGKRSDDASWIREEWEILELAMMGAYEGPHDRAAADWADAYVFEIMSAGSVAYVEKSARSLRVHSVQTVTPDGIPIPVGS